MIEKRITESLLEAGGLTLAPGDRAELGLPEHSTTIDVELEGEAFRAQWSGRTRQLSGDILAERLQDYGQVGGLLRIHLVDSVYRLLLLPPGSQMQAPRTVVPRSFPSKPAAGTKAARRHATVDRQFHSDDKYDWGNGETRTIGFLTEARELLSHQLKAAGWDPLEMVELRLQGEELATLDDFEELLAVDVANVDRMPHQAAVARRALSRLRGRAILADEVGLGKTIEAGLAIKELTLRGLAKRMLILCPAPLRDQWREEMNTKFDLQFDVAHHGVEVADQDKLIVSLTLGTREVEKLTKRPWDIVIVDEAHRAAGALARKRRDLITALTTACRYAFFLTATPVQNDLLELYRLVELLRPGTFKSVRAFKREFMRGRDLRTPSDPAALRRLISSAMIRTTRAQAGVDRVVRRAVDMPIELGTRERELYALSTDLLRNVMQSPGDTMRRRSLALRLTASPFSMGTTALRMAERHPDERVRKVLNEVGHLAMDIKGSARENRALEITRDWLRDHGRILIFTQHTDTVTGLLRRMGADGLNARAFHGSMSPRERAATISAFKSGDAPIMISTDAGAEGQNLQFCNCVLNYDLPWNPMRIEQRIGRVDRLTQPRDEVFVANLYATGTIDQSVYRLLAEKLRMFELLFGQVTTILGELDDSKSAPFESRVLDALFAETDSKMEQLLAQLGTELADARERASTLIAADSGLSSWMGSAFDHREGLTKAGSPELAPEVSERARIRQRRVQAWVRRVLDALDAQILHNTGDGDGAFLTAQLDDELADELGGRTLLHLAFDRRGLENHPDAELCAVGSPIFDELLGLLRMRGDMHTTVPVIPDDPGPSPFEHASAINLARRRLIPGGTWSGHATFRATVGEAETVEHIITAEINGSRHSKLPRRALQDGESLPAAFEQPQAVISAFESAAAGQLEELRRSRVDQVSTEQARELDRIRTGYVEQIAEAASDDVDRLRRALESEVRRLSRQPDIRARAKLLALTLDEDDWLVEETWARPDGTEGTLTYEFGLSGPPRIDSVASREAIKVLALCSDAHWVDESEIIRCGSCAKDLCGACGDVAVFAGCPVCAVSCCAKCRATTGGFCIRCNSPDRAPELDSKFAIGWRLNQGVTLLVGERVAELAWPDMSDAFLIVPDEDVNDPSRTRMRSYAASNGLPVDSGLALRTLNGHSPPQQDPSRIRLRTIEAIKTELAVSDSADSSINVSAVGALPQYDAPAVDSESAFRLVSLLKKLRSEVLPPSPPCVVVTRRSEFTDLELDAKGLVERVSVATDDGGLETIEAHDAPFRWKAPSIEDEVVAEIELAGLSVVLVRRNEAILASTRGELEGDVQQWIALPDGADAADQLAWFDHLVALGTPGGRVGQPSHHVDSLDGPFASPSECELVDRHIESIAELVTLDSEVDLSPADPTSLAALKTHHESVASEAFDQLPVALNQALLEQARRPFSSTVRTGFEVHETWRGHGTATHRYRVFDGIPVAPRLDDLGTSGTDFGVCRDGHFYAAGTAACCAACATWACRKCDDAEHQASIECPGCKAAVCRRCLSAGHTVPTDQCAICGDTACPDCGRNPEVLSCEVCDRSICAGCRAGELCPACSQFAPATEEQLGGLPRELAVKGASVAVGSDEDATTLVIDRGDALEQAVVRGGTIARWVTFGQTDIDDVYRLRLAASSKLGVQVNPIVESLDTEHPIGEPHVVVHWERSFTPTWSVTDLGLSGRGRLSLPTPSSGLACLIAGDFPPTRALPNAIPELPDRIGRVIASIKPPQLVDLVVRWHRSGHDVLITADGITCRTLDGPSISEELIPWSANDTTPDWVVAAWDPIPAVGTHAIANGTEAVIVGIASLVALGVRTAEHLEWYAVSASPNAVPATALARSMGVGDADEVSAFTDPAQVKRSTVLNSRDTALHVTPLGMVTDRGGDHPEATTADALHAWMPNTHLRKPDLGVLPHALRTPLEQRLKAALPLLILEIGAQIEEIISVDDGQAWLHEVRLEPGQTDARRIDTVTRVRLDEGVIDREGHFIGDAMRCLYCDAKVCAHCTDRLVSCDCCNTAICRRCVGEPFPSLFVCPACAALRPPSGDEAREHKRSFWSGIFSTRSMLIGTDPQHTVVVELTKHRWMRYASGSEKAAIANPSVIKFLNERLTDAGSD